MIYIRVIVAIILFFVSLQSMQVCMDARAPAHKRHKACLTSWLTAIVFGVILMVILG